MELSLAWDRLGIKPDAIYSSIAVRAIETARPTTKKFGLSIHTVEDLQELSWGDLEGFPRTTQQEERQAQSFTFRPRNGESANDVRDRGMRALWKISQKKDGPIVFVFSHQNLIKNVIREYMGWRSPAELEAAKLGVCSATTLKMLSPTKLEVLKFNQELI